MRGDEIPIINSHLPPNVNLKYIVVGWQQAIMTPDRTPKIVTVRELLFI